MQKMEAYLAQIDEWEYGYCRNCGRIRYSFDLKATDRGIQCLKCGGYDLEAPNWIYCPHRKVTVKCARAGRGLIQEEYAYECEHRCRFLMP